MAGVPAVSSLASRLTSGSRTSWAHKAEEDGALLTPTPPSKTALASDPPAPAGARLWFQRGSKPTPTRTASADANQARAVAEQACGATPPPQDTSQKPPRKGPAWETHLYSGRELEQAQEFQKFFYLQIT